MEKKPVISVIVPVYNVEKYLERCIDSILQQTFRDFELILVDDGSPDNCPEICDRYQEKDDRIKVIHKENGGLSTARNAGIDASKGEYISFIDSDDYVSENMLERLYTVINKTNSDMAICSFIYKDEDTDKVYDNGHLPVKDEIFSGDEIIRKKIFEPYRIYWIVAWNKLYKRELWKDKRFPIGKNIEDFYILPEIFLECNKVACISEKNYFYVQRKGSIMNNALYKRISDQTSAYFHLAQIFSMKETLEGFSIKAMKCGLGMYKSFLLEKQNRKLLGKNVKKQIQQEYRETLKKMNRNIKCIPFLEKMYFRCHYISIELMCILKNV